MVASSSDVVKKQWQDGIQLIREEAMGSSLAEALHKAAANEENPKNRSGSVLCAAETDDCQRLLHFGHGHTQGDGIRRQHLPRGLSGMYSSRTSGRMKCLMLIPPPGYSYRQLLALNKRSPNLIGAQHRTRIDMDCSKECRYRGNACYGQDYRAGKREHTDIRGFYLIK